MPESDSISGSTIFLVLLSLQMLFSMISAAIIVNEEKDKKSPKTIYGGILVASSLVWLIVLVLTIYTKGIFNLFK